MLSPHVDQLVVVAKSQYSGVPKVSFTLEAADFTLGPEYYVRMCG